MSEILTAIGLRGLPVVGLMDWGRKTRAEMIDQIRTKARQDMASAQAVLAAKDEDFYVRVVRGPIVQHLVEEIEP